MTNISICIPTYNRGKDLDELLRSINAAITGTSTESNIEIIISDNASTDDTKFIVEKWHKKLPRIFYKLNETNIGFAANINQAVKLSSGDYCWLMGSDEKITLQALPLVLKAIESKHDIYIGDPITNEKERKLISGQTKIFNISSFSEYAKFIDECTEISSAFAFISTLIIRKEFWTSGNCSDYEAHHPYTHMLRIAGTLGKRGGSIVYLGASLVTTGHNINEWNKLPTTHFLLDLQTIQYLIHNVFESSKIISSAYFKLFVRQYKKAKVSKIRLEADFETWENIENFLSDCKYPRWAYKKTKLDFLYKHLYRTKKKIQALIKNL